MEKVLSVKGQVNLAKILYGNVVKREILNLSFLNLHKMQFLQLAA